MELVIRRPTFRLPEAPSIWVREDPLGICATIEHDLRSGLAGDEDSEKSPSEA
jgi:hypothetical protein